MKKMFCFLLAVCLIAGSAVSSSALNYDIVGTGKNIVTIGDWVCEKIDNGSHWEIDQYIGEGGEVIVPWRLADIMVVSLGDHCFANNTSVTSVITTSPPWSFGEYCFLDCTSLEKVQLNSMLDNIGIGAFSGTSALKDINLQDSIVTEIKPYTFLNSGIEEVELPETCVEISHDAFAQCSQLKKIVIPETVTTIHEDAFRMSDNVMIYANKGCYAIEYAQANGIDYIEKITYLSGDSDGDGFITVLDATKIQRVLASLESDEDGMIHLRGNVSGGGLSVIDATNIQRYLAIIPVSVPIGVEVTVEIP